MDQEAGEGVPVFGVAFFDPFEEDLNPFFIMPLGEGLIGFEKETGALFGG
jgi:hypothetical protein